jgi:hypothetical protein
MEMANNNNKIIDSLSRIKNEFELQLLSLEVKFQNFKGWSDR